MTTRLKSACKAGILVAACVSLAICSSCSDEEVMNGSGQSDKLSFGVSLSDKWETASKTRSTAGETPERSTFKFDGSDLWLIATSGESMDSTLFTKPEKTQTRAAAVTTGSFYDSFGVYAYVYEGDDWTSGQNVKPYFTAEKVTQSGGGLWTTSPTRFWPGEQYRMHFFACAPHDITQKVTVNDNTPELAYTVPDDVKDQKDLIVATADVQGNYNSSVPLKFKHILTAVKVKAAEGVSGTITKVALTGIKNTGNYTFGETEWSGVDGSVSFVQEFDPGKELDGSGETFVVDDDNTFMMIPQVLADEARIEVVYKDAQTSTERTLTASIAGHEWPFATTVIYKISTTSIEPVLEVTPPLDIHYTGDQKSYTVTSYVTRGNGQRPVGWTTEFVEGDEESGYTVIKKPDWLTTFTTEDNEGSTTAKSYWANASMQTGVIQDNRHTLVLRNTASISGPNPYNLSNATGASEVERTANCYVINAPGTYSLPLVYGNAIDKEKNPTSPYHNTSAYISKGSGSKVLRTFFNHAGEAITDPYIYKNNNCMPASVKLIWQDAENLVSDIKFSSDEHSLVFTVNQATIAEGNAVVAVCDASDKVMWSWHIWVTDYKLGDDLKTVTNSGIHTMLPYNLGWCNGTIKTFAERSVKVRFTQNETGKQRVITVTQAYGEETIRGTQPFYQWGRKDPMLPWDGTSGTANKTWYDASGTSSTSLSTASWSSKEVITAGILNPGTYCTNNRMDNTYYNLWAADNNSNSGTLATSTKTVYDPCPVGYKVPLLDAFGTFESYIGEYDEDEKGLYFTCAEGKVFFPLTGYRNQSSGQVYFNSTGTHGYYWSAVPNNAYQGLQFQIQYTGYVKVKTITYRSWGSAVRPVQEN